MGIVGVVTHPNLDFLAVADYHNDPEANPLLTWDIEDIFLIGQDEEYRWGTRIV